MQRVIALLTAQIETSRSDALIAAQEGRPNDKYEALKTATECSATIELLKTVTPNPELLTETYRQMAEGQ